MMMNMIPEGGPQHVWVTKRSTYDDGERLPGLLLEWRQREDGSWEGWCVYVALGHPEGSGPQQWQGWIPSERIERVRSDG